MITTRNETASIEDKFNRYIEKLNDDRAKQQQAQKVMKTLEGRVDFMVYDEDHEAYYAAIPSIVELLLDDDDLGLEIARMLRRAIPSCSDKEEFEIIIKDVINPNQMGSEIRPVAMRAWSFPNKDNDYFINDIVLRKDNKDLFFDDRFVVLMEYYEEAIVIWIFKYPR